jgi:radical SAM family RiPP maturation amino acid epimerase
MEFTTVADKEVVRQLVGRANEMIETGEIELVYLNRAKARDRNVAYERELAEIKRVLERWSADSAFRARLEADPAGATAALSLALDPAPLKYLWDTETALKTEVADIPLPSFRYRAFILEKLTHRRNMRAEHPDFDRRFAAWRRRQLVRVDNQLSTFAAGSIVHAPFCIELCNGCSVGCWFCGISAPKLGDIFSYTPENAELFGGIVAKMKLLLGEATGRGFLYWATDPFDNPDYEKFMVDFHAQTNVFPQTTTALALKDITRTRALLELSREKGGMLDRFSLLSLKQLDRVHAEFTAEELLFVELVTQNREGHQAKARAGRAMTDRSPSRQDTKSFPGNETAEGTIACVSGFLINPIHGSVKLISPCAADAEHPLGYIVFGEERFRTSAEFAVAIDRLVDAHMIERLRGHEPVSVYSHFAVEPLADGLRIKGKHCDFVMSGTPALSGLATGLANGGASAGDLIDEIVATSGTPAAEIMHALNLLLDHGVLDTLAAEQRVPRLEPAQ